MGAKVSAEMRRARALLAQGLKAAEAARQAGITDGAISKDAVCRDILAARKLAERVLAVLAPDQFGGHLTAERIGDIIGDPDNFGCSIGTERALSALEILENAGRVRRQKHSYTLT